MSVRSSFVVTSVLLGVTAFRRGLRSVRGAVAVALPRDVVQQPDHDVVDLLQRTEEGFDLLPCQHILPTPPGRQVGSLLDRLGINDAEVVLIHVPYLGQVQGVDATIAPNLSAGVSYPRVFRGLVLSFTATASSSFWL